MKKGPVLTAKQPCALICTQYLAVIQKHLPFWISHKPPVASCSNDREYCVNQLLSGSNSQSTSSTPGDKLEYCTGRMLNSPGVIKREALLPPKLKPLAVELNSCPNKATQAQLGRSDNSARIGSEQSGLKKERLQQYLWIVQAFPLHQNVQMCVLIFM